jgi:hypothetical protein
MLRASFPHCSKKREISKKTLAHLTPYVIENLTTRKPLFHSILAFTSLQGFLVNSVTLGKFSYYFYNRNKHNNRRSALVWVITQRIAVIHYRHPKTTYRSHLRGSRFLTLEDGTGRLSRNVGNELPLLAT